MEEIVFSVKHIEVLVKTVILLVICSVSILVLMNLERRVVAFLQMRKFSSKRGMWQSLIDVMKLLSKEDSSVGDSRLERFLYGVVPIICVALAVGPLSLIPICQPIVHGELLVNPELFETKLGMFYMLVVVLLGFHGMYFIGEVIENSSLTVQRLFKCIERISFELPMIIVVFTMFFFYDSMDIHAIVKAQSKGLWDIVPQLGLLVQPVAGIIFFISIFVRASYLSYGVRESSLSLFSRYSLNYTPSKCFFLLFAEYLHLLAVVLMFVFLFCGGYELLPFVDNLLGYLPAGSIYFLQAISLILKVIVVFIILTWCRWSLPEADMRRVLEHAWRKIVPISIINLIATVGIELFYNYKG